MLLLLTSFRVMTYRVLPSMIFFSVSSYLVSFSLNLWIEILRNGMATWGNCLLSSQNESLRPPVYHVTLARHRIGWDDPQRSLHCILRWNEALRAPLRSSFSTLLLIIVFIRVIVDFFHHLLSPLYVLRFSSFFCVVCFLYCFCFARVSVSPPPPLKRWRARRDIVGCDLLRLSLLTFVRPSLLYGHVFVLLLRFLLLLLFVSFVWGAILLFYYCSHIGACLDGQYWVLSLSGPFSSLFPPFCFSLFSMLPLCIIYFYL